MSDRDPRVLNDPALKATPAMLAAFEAVLDLEEHAQVRGVFTVRLVDADTLLDPPMPGRQVRARSVEILIDHDGVLIVGTGWDVTRPVFFKSLLLPHPATQHLFEFELGSLVGQAMAEVQRSTRAPWPPESSSYL